MEVQLFATPEERYALATRFRLSDISSLTADLVVQPALSGGNTGDVGECIEASGTVCAQVTQTCGKYWKNISIYCFVVHIMYKSIYTYHTLLQ